MYTQSTTRQLSIALVLVATLAGIVAAGIEPGHTVGAAGAGQIGSLPVLPEIVVTASRLEA
jgi:hypothetical protein